MNTNKPNVGKPVDASEPKECDDALLVKLNSLHRKVVSATQRVCKASTTGTAEDIAERNEELVRSRRMFDDLIACMPPVKFNTATGEYMFKYDENGKERFVFFVDRMIRNTVYVSAENEECARKSVQDMITDLKGYETLHTDVVCASHSS